jgi:dihydroorotase
VLEARRRGVIFDIGHGSGSFGFRTAEAMLTAGFLPDVISSDVHALSINGPAFDQLVTMSKFLCLGVELVDVIRASTAAPAAVLGRTDIGSWQSARWVMPACSNWKKVISNTEMSWARFAPDGNGSKRVDLW